MEKNALKGLRPAKRSAYKKFSYSFSAGMAILCALSLYRGFPVWITYASALLCSYHLICAAFIPEGAALSYGIITAAGRFTGSVISAVLFTIVYYLLFSPIALILRMTGHDKIKSNSVAPEWADVDERENNPERIRHLY